MAFVTAILTLSSSALMNAPLFSTSGLIVSSCSKYSSASTYNCAGSTANASALISFSVRFVPGSGLSAGASVTVRTIFFTPGRHGNSSADFIPEYIVSGVSPPPSAEIFSSDFFSAAASLVNSWSTRDR